LTLADDIQAFIFDLDGVITDTAEFHFLAWKRMADEEGIPFTRQDNDRLRGVSRRESLSRILKGQPIDEATAEAWMARKNNYYLDHLNNLTPQDCLPGVVEFLKAVRQQNIKTGLGSASKNAGMVLEKLCVATLFDAVGDGYSVVNTKPAPDLFIWVAGALHVSPPQAVVFEDAEAGIDAALAGGFWTVGIGEANVDHAHVKATGLAALQVPELLEQFKTLAAQPTSL
jgi:beta-phosphoglucomutase